MKSFLKNTISNLLLLVILLNFVSGSFAQAVELESGSGDNENALLHEYFYHEDGTPLSDEEKYQKALMIVEDDSILTLFDKYAALALLEDLNGYKDSEELIKETYAWLGVYSYQIANNYDLYRVAIDQLMLADNRGDSADYLTKARYNLVYYYILEHGEPFTLSLDGKDYKAISKKVEVEGIDDVNIYLLCEENDNDYLNIIKILYTGRSLSEHTNMETDFLYTLNQYSTKCTFQYFTVIKSIYFTLKAGAGGTTRINEMPNRDTLNITEYTAEGTGLDGKTSTSTDPDVPVKIYYDSRQSMAYSMDNTLIGPMQKAYEITQQAVAEMLSDLSEYGVSLSDIYFAPVELTEEQKAAAYVKAEEMLNNGELYKAATTFYSIKDYKDSWNRCFNIWGKLSSREESISACNRNSYAIRKDGTVVAVGDTQYGQCKVSNMYDIEAISAGYASIIGLKGDGTVVSAGAEIPGYEHLGICDVQEWSDIVSVSAGFAFTAGLKADGTVIATGDNGFKQCEVKGWENIIAISAGGYHIVGLQDDGTVIATGGNDYGQCDLSRWNNIISIASGAEHTVGLKANGTVVAIGNNNYGQCEVSDWEKIIAIASNNYTTVGLKEDGTVVICGAYIMDYEDEISKWSDIVAISCGIHVLGIKSDGTVLAAGPNDLGNCNVSYWKNIRIPE